jgi:hypothetical protein
VSNNSAVARRIRIVFMALLLSAGLVAAQAGPTQRATRIRFMRGAMSAQVRGQLTKDKSMEALYVVSARAGEHMIVNIIPVTRGLLTGGVVTSPSGKQEGQHGGMIFNQELTETGDYTIRVARNLMGTERLDGSFILEVVVTPSYIKS